MAIPSTGSLMKVLNRNRLGTYSRETSLNISYPFLSQLLLTTFWLFLLSDRSKMCRIFLKFCFSSLLLTGLLGTILKPYLKSMRIISTLPTWPITLSKQKTDYLVFIICSRQIHISCSLAIYYPRGWLYIYSYFFRVFLGIKLWLDLSIIPLVFLPPFYEIKHSVCPSVIFWDVTYPQQVLEYNHWLFRDGSC